MRVWGVASAAWDGIGPRFDQDDLTRVDRVPGARSTPPGTASHFRERFYTDRPEQGFGQNSGLGLSISKQIVEAHGGTVRVENRMGGQPSRVLGARFIVRLPAT